MINEMGGDFLQWLRGFYYVAKRGSVTLAASEMMRNQPTITHQIKCLEREFGVTLFDRSTGRMLLTPEGELLLEKAISIFEIIKEMKSEVSDTHLEQRGKVSMASSHAIVQFFLPQYVSDFRAAHPHVEFSIEGGGLEMILERIESGEVDFGIAHLYEIPVTVSYYDLFETGRMLIAPKNNPFGLQGEPTLKQILETPFIFFPYSISLRPFFDKKFSESSLKLNLSIVLNNFNSIKKYVAMGLGVSILDDYTLTKIDEKRFDIFSMDRFFKRRTYGLIVRKRKYLTPAAKAFILSIKPDIQF